MTFGEAGELGLRESHLLACERKDLPLRDGCNEFSSVLSSHGKVYGWINSVMN
jgi:hypothetical protein